MTFLNDLWKKFKTPTEKKEWQDFHEEEPIPRQSSLIEQEMQMS